jgi:CheY-like chemotaxis protein
MANLLVIDDSILSRSMAADALRDAGHSVTEAANGRLGVAAFEEDPPDCVVTDLLMPVMDGEQVVRYIRGIDREIPVFVLTADVQASTTTALRTLGATGLLHKPVKAPELVSLVEAALARAKEVSNADDS